MTDWPEASLNSSRSFDVAIEAMRERLDKFRCERIGPHRLFLGDCLQILPLIGNVDAVVADPPYGIDFRGGTRSRPQHDVYAGGKYHRDRNQKIIGDNEDFDPSPFLQWPCVLWGANNFSSKLPDSNGWLCWHKDGGIKGFAMSQCELAWTNVLTSTRHFSHMWHGFKRDSEVGEKVVHPTQKPIALMRWCIEQLSPGYEVILDPYMGSGGTGVACVKLGRRFIGIEIDPRYFEIACSRVQDAVNRPDLFIDQPREKPVQTDFLAEVSA